SARRKVGPQAGGGAVVHAAGESSAVSPAEDAEPVVDHADVDGMDLRLEPLGGVPQGRRVTRPTSSLSLRERDRFRGLPRNQGEGTTSRPPVDALCALPPSPCLVRYAPRLSLSLGERDDVDGPQPALSATRFRHSAVNSAVRGPRAKRPRIDSLAAAPSEVRSRSSRSSRDTASMIARESSSGISNPVRSCSRISAVPPT